MSSAVGHDKGSAQWMKSQAVESPSSNAMLSIVVPGCGAQCTLSACPPPPLCTRMTAVPSAVELTQLEEGMSTPWQSLTATSVAWPCLPVTGIWEGAEPGDAGRQRGVE